MLLRGINGVLIVLSVLELCVVISAAVLGIQTLRSKQNATKPKVWPSIRSTSTVVHSKYYHPSSR